MEIHCLHIEIALHPVASRPALVPSARHALRGWLDPGRERGRRYERRRRIASEHPADEHPHDRSTGIRERQSTTASELRSRSSGWANRLGPFDVCYLRPGARDLSPKPMQWPGPRQGS